MCLYIDISVLTTTNCDGGLTVAIIHGNHSWKTDIGGKLWYYVFGPCLRF